MAEYKETTKRLIKEHLTNKNGQLYCQALLGCGFVGNTVPDDIPNHKGMEELPTSDVSNSGIVVGAALAGRRPIYVVRYQGFLIYNLSSIAMYAAKSKSMWNQPCPLFVRAISMSGSIGPVASNSYHAFAAHMPGIKIFAPMTSNEFEFSWNEFLNGDDPVFCSEHRRAFNINYEMLNDIEFVNPDVTLIGISDARLEIIEAKKELDKINIKANIGHVFKLKPLEIPQEVIESCKNSKLVIIVDSGHEICGMSEHLVYILMRDYNLRALALGISDKTAGFAPHTDVKTPNFTEIVNFIQNEQKKL